MAFRAKPTAAVLGIAALALGFGLGRATAPRSDAELSTLASFHGALGEPDWLARTYRMSAFLQGLSPENLPAALDALEPQLPWLVTDELRLFMLAWSRFDPPAALERALGWPQQFRRNGSGAAVYAWAFRDPEAALRALDSVEDAELREFMEGRLVAGWVHGLHKQSADDYIATLPEGPRRLRYLGLLAWELSKQGPAAVISWAEQVPDSDPRYKADVFLQTSSALSDIDPSTTSAWLQPHLGRPYAADALGVLARSWALQDPNAAMAWATRLPPGDREGAVGGAFSAWLDQSPADAERWLRSATPASTLDPAVRVLVRRKRQQSPAEALDWALTIADPAQRRGLLGDVGRAWLRRDPAAARAWLERELPDGVAAEILDSAQPAGSGAASGAPTSP